jgi:hypothetical protein
VEEGIAYRITTTVKLVPEKAAATPKKAKSRRKGEEEPGIVHKFVKTRKQVLVPAILTDKLLHVAHSGPLAGHPGITRCLQSLEKEYYWPTMKKDIISFVKSCPTCQVVGKGDRIRKIPIKLHEQLSAPFQTVAIDFIGPLPTSKKGNSYILSVIDVSTRYAEAIPMKSMSSKAVSEELIKIFSRVGFPEKLMSDCAPNFMGKLMDGLCRVTGMSQVHSTPYHPMSNGSCERFNGSIQAMLKCALLNNETNRWDDYLPHLLFAYRSLPVANLGYSPFELLYGRQMRGPLQEIQKS